MAQPLLLDLFTGGGGAGEGYARAGFRVVGVDLDPKPLRHNPHECYVGNALAVLDTLIAGEAWQGYHLTDFAAIHASPVCKDYSRLKVTNSREYPRLISPTRERLRRTGLPWVIENVIMDRKDWGEMPSAIVLCGSAFGLKVIRHRQFESSHLLMSAGPCQHKRGATLTGEFLTVTGHCGYHRNQPPHTVDACRKAMGIDWMTATELSQAVPPAYTEWLGAQLLRVV